MAIQDDESLIKKHPPRRLQRLEDQQQSLTHELIDEKQAEAEQRRNNVSREKMDKKKIKINNNKAKFHIFQIFK